MLICLVLNNNKLEEGLKNVEMLKKKSQTRLETEKFCRF